MNKLHFTTTLPQLDFLLGDSNPQSYYIFNQTPTHSDPKKVKGEG